MAYSFSLVECYEVHGTAKENKTLDDWTASVQLRTPWAKRHLLMDDILGNQRRWPYWPYAGGIGLYPRNAALAVPATDFTSSGQGMDYEFANINVNYGIPGKTDQPDPSNPVDLASESLEPTSEFITEDYRLFKWKYDGQPLTEGEEPGRLIRGLRLVRTIFKVATLNANILTLPGTVNDAEWTSPLLGLTFAAETLLFVPPQLSRTITTAGASAWNLRLGWEYKPNGWNKWWRQELQDYDTIVAIRDGTDYEPYTPTSQSPWLP